MKMLIVDDNEQNLYMLRVLMQASGYQVETAANGEEALSKARAEHPDIIISDILMPVMDGFTLCREWKKDGALETIPFVFYTATYTDPGDEEFALSLGAERFIRKPAEPEVFIGILREVIEQYKAGQLVAKREAVAEEAVYFKLYNETLIRKLEGKIEQLEEANKALKEEITKRKQVEEALKKGEERFRTSVEALLEGFAILSAVRDSNGQLIDFRYEYINEAGCKMNQKTREEHMGKTLLELLPTHKEIGLFDEYVLVVETEQPLVKEHVIYEPVFGGSDRLKQAFYLRISRLEHGIVVTWQDITEKKRREELLRQSEERLKRLVENSKDIIVMADLEGEVLYYNGPPGYGVKTEDVLGKNAFSIFEPVIAARLMNQLRRVVREKEALTIESFISWRGEPFWFSIHMYPIQDEQNRMYAVGVIARNITERKRAEEALKRAVSQWQTTFNAIGDSICLIDNEGKILQHNMATEHLLGKPSQEIIGRHCWEVVHSGSEPIEGCPIVQMRESLRRETLVIQQGDRWFKVTTDPLLDEGGNLMGGVHIIVDITDQRQAEEVLRESEQRFRNLVESILAITYEIGVDGVFTYVSPVVKGLLGYEPDELIGRHFLEVMHEEDHDFLMGRFSELSKGIVQQIDHRVIDKDGNIRWVRTLNNAIIEGGGLCGRSRDAH